MNKKIQLLFNIILLIFIGCKKKESENYPQIEFKNPQNKSTIYTDSTVLIDISQFSHAFSKVELFLDGNHLAVLSNQPYQFIWKPNWKNAGIHKLTAIGYHFSGITSDEVEVVIKDYRDKVEGKYSGIKFYSDNVNSNGEKNDTSEANLYVIKNDLDSTLIEIKKHPDDPSSYFVVYLDKFNHFHYAAPSIVKPNFYKDSLFLKIIYDDFSLNYFTKKDQIDY